MWTCFLWNRTVFTPKQIEYCQTHTVNLIKLIRCNARKYRLECQNCLVHNNVASAPIQRTTHLERIELVATKVSTNPRSIFSFKIQDVGWYHNYRSELSPTQHDMFLNNSKQERRMFLTILHVCGIFGTSDKNTQIITHQQCSKLRSSKFLRGSLLLSMK